MFWPLVPLVIALGTGGTARAAAPADEDERKKRRAARRLRGAAARVRRRKRREARAAARRRKRRQERAARRRAATRGKAARPGDGLPDPIADLLDRKPPAPEPAPAKKKRTRRTRRRKAAAPAPVEKTPRRRRKRRKKKRTRKRRARTRTRTAPAPAPATDRRVAAAREFVDALRGRKLDRNGVARYQRILGKLDPDGIPGAKTKARVEELLLMSVDWSGITAPRTPLVPTPPEDPKAAARELAAYVNVYGGKRTPRIRKYQTALGLKASGVVDARTRARVEQLTGETLK